jgi:predicted O-methyltransferase YrrM
MNLRSFSVFAANLFPELLDVRLIDLDQVDGNTTLEEQVLIVALAKRQRARRVFEFGTFDGKTSANLAVNLGAEAEILTIDLESASAEAARLAIKKECQVCNVSLPGRQRPNLAHCIHW